MTERSAAAPRKRPVFKGLSLHKEPYLGFSFFRPLDWHRFEWTDERQGVLFGPHVADNATLLGVAVQDLDLTVTAADIPALHNGFLDAIRQLPDSQIEWQEQWQVGDLIGLEAKYTFREGEETRKRWVRVLYQDTRQLTVTAQGATVADYEYWLPMFYQSIMTFRIYTTPGYKLQQPAETS